MARKYSALLLILFIVGLYFLQNKAIMPLVEKVVESDVLLEDSDDNDESEELGSIRNDRTDLAFSHCKEAFKAQYGEEINAELSVDQYQAWALASKSYLVRSTAKVAGEGSEGTEKPFACKIQYTGSDPSDASSWTISGIDFNE